MSDELKASKQLFKDAKSTLEARKQAEVAERRAAEKWTPEMRREYVRDYKRENRLRMLQRLAPGLVCKGCGTTRASMRSWVIFDTAGTLHALCKSCHQKQRSSKQ